MLDVSPEKIGGLLLSLDDQKNIRKEKSWENLEKSPSSRRQPFIPNVSRVIAACDPELAFKVFIPLSIKREAGAEQLEKTELENLLAQAIGKVFNHHRREASTVLGADELDTILADSNVSGFEVDGHRVMNPIGFRPKEINAVMEMTFAARQTFERVKAIRKKGDFFFTEKGQAQAAAYDTFWHPQVIQLSALHNKGVDAFWAAVTQFRNIQTANGRLAERRRHQSLAWMWERIDAGLKQAFRQDPAVSALLPTLVADVESGRIPASTAARNLLAAQSRRAPAAIK